MDINMPDMDGISATRSHPQKDTYYSSRYSFSTKRFELHAPCHACRGAGLSSQAADDCELIAAIRRAGTMAQEERAKVPQAFLPRGKVDHHRLLVSLSKPARPL